MKYRSRRRELALAVGVWCGVLVLLVLATSGIGLAKRGLPLEGWGGSTVEQIVGWTFLTSPYVLVLWTPVAVGVIAVSALLNLSRRAWVALSLVLALAMLVLVATVA